MLKIKESLGKELLQHCVPKEQGVLEWRGRVPHGIYTHISKTNAAFHSCSLQSMTSVPREMFKNYVYKNPTRLVRSRCKCVQVWVFLWFCMNLVTNYCNNHNRLLNSFLVITSIGLPGGLDRLGKFSQTSSLSFFSWDCECVCVVCMDEGVWYSDSFWCWSFLSQKQPPLSLSVSLSFILCSEN